MFKLCRRYGKATLNEVDDKLTSGQYKVRWLDENAEDTIYKNNGEIVQQIKLSTDKDESESVIIPDVRREGVREAIVVDSNLKINVHEKSEKDIHNIKSIISSNEFLATVLKDNFMEDIIDAMCPLEIKDGDIIIKEGDYGDHLYISDSGTFEVYANNKLIKTFSDQRVFGELALLYNNKRSTTVRAASNGKLWMLQRKIFQQTLVRDAVKYLEETFSFLKHVPLVNKLNDDKLNKIANLLKKEFFKTNTVIVQENDEGDKFYIIRAGCVTVSKEREGKVAELTKGDFFGEEALLQASDTREATVIAESPGVECLTLSRSDFHEHFDEDTLSNSSSKQNKRLSIDRKQIPNGKTPKGNLSIEKTLPQTFEAKEATILTESPNEECHILARSEFNERLSKPSSVETRQTPKEETTKETEHSDVDLSSLRIIDTLGVGGFGRVVLVQHKTQPHRTFALKYLKKYEMVKREQIQHVYNEKALQIQCDSMFITRLYKTFQDSKYLYFLTESCLGGDLWSHIQNRSVNRCLSEHDSKFYSACALEAIAYLHERNIIYRDLKPENLLIDNKGYLKLTDLGFAKRLERGAKTFTFAGTPEYVAPEIIYNRGHNHAADCWAFGILIFELLVGMTPFSGGDHMKIYNRILRGIANIQFPPTVSKNAVSIIVKLCKEDPMERLGAMKNGVDDIRNHKWFSGFDWVKLRSRKMKPPFMPKLKNNIDTRYFEKFKQDDSIPPDELTAFSSF